VSASALWILNRLGGFAGGIAFAPKLMADALHTARRTHSRVKTRSGNSSSEISSSRMAPLLLTLCAGTALLFSPARASVPAPRPQLRVAAPQLVADWRPAAVTKVSTPTLSVAIFKNLIGAGVFLIPAGVVRVGLAPALLALVIAGVISAATFYAFGRAASQTGTRTTSDMWSATVGPKSAWAYDSVLFLMCFGGLIQYTVTIVNLLQQVPAPAALAVLSQRTPAVLAAEAARPRSPRRATPATAPLGIRPPLLRRRTEAEIAALRATAGRRRSSPRRSTRARAQRGAGGRRRASPLGSGMATSPTAVAEREPRWRGLPPRRRAARKQRAAPCAAASE